jgi:hypothetical protein
MPNYNEKEKIREHYDLVSPYYQTLWGEHLHHGYWIHGDETKEKAQLQLTSIALRRGTSAWTSSRTKRSGSSRPNMASRSFTG